ncbi:MAG: hypothetical protein HYZ73_01755 [Elusimicrobia bacterium]|nr:hypothetical protein [Elusimicrobiota bacterium]
MRIGFTYDAKADYELRPGDLPDRFDEFDGGTTLQEIEEALRSEGHEVTRIGHVRNLLQRLTAGERWDIVFNIAEGLDGRNRESQIPMLLELFGQPFTASDALTMGMTLDKTIAKKIVSVHGVPTPRFLEVRRVDDLSQAALKFPAIVKPSEEGTSKGLSPESVVRTPKQLATRVGWVLDTYRQPALVEEFIVGQEFTVAVVGNDPPEALPPVQIAIAGQTDLGEEFYTHARVESNEIEYLCPAPISPAVDQQLRTIALQAFQALECRDVARIDIRMDRTGTPFFLECNPLPNLGQIDVFPKIARAIGQSYDSLILRILHAACKRYGLPITVAITT